MPPYATTQMHKKLTAIFGKTPKPILQFREFDTQKQIRRLCDEAFGEADGGPISQLGLKVKSSASSRTKRLWNKRQFKNLL